MFKLKSLILCTLVSLSLVMAISVTAATITFDQTDFMVSTVTTTTSYYGGLDGSPATVPALPDNSTFTLAPTSDNLYLDTYVGKFLKYDFVLPVDYSNLTFTFNASVNDEYALYINDTVVAIQATTTAVNFAAPLPGFSMDSAGNAVDTSAKLEYLLATGMDSLFQTGANELILYGTDTLEYGGFISIAGTINYDIEETPVNGVSEPATLLLLGLCFAGLAGMRRKFKH